MLCALGRERDAVKAGKEWARAQPANAAAHAALARLLARLGKHTECKSACKRWREADRGDTEPLEVRAEALRALGQHEEAAKDCTSWLHLLATRREKAEAAEEEQRRQQQREQQQQQQQQQQQGSIGGADDGGGGGTSSSSSSSGSATNYDSLQVGSVLALRARALAASGQATAAARDYGAILGLPTPPRCSAAESAAGALASAREAAHRRMVCAALSRRTLLLQKLGDWGDAAADCRRWLALDPANPLAQQYLAQAEAGERKAAKSRHGGKHSGKHSKSSSSSSSKKSKSSSKGGSGHGKSKSKSKKPKK